ncbi:hypothetical protein LC612_41600 [Nostoc sp. CHAB 5834]|nr:hypothetical protein [Nostoc sp. CHAB 5834]
MTRAGAIVDPTAWVFSATQPKLTTYWPGTPGWDGIPDIYDEAMEQMAAVMHRSIGFPRTDPAQKQYYLDNPMVADGLSDMLKSRGFKKEAILTSYTPEQIGWFGRIPPSQWGLAFAASFYQELEKYSLLAMVPMDYLTKIRRIKAWRQL